MTGTAASALASECTFDRMDDVPPPSERQVVGLARPEWQKALQLSSPIDVT